MQAKVRQGLIGVMMGIFACLFDHRVYFISNLGNVN